MAYWLYQMNSSYWSPALYRGEVWEGERTNWIVRRKVPKENSPKPGDIMVLFYAPAGEPDPGIYGWSVVISFDPDEKFYWVRFVPSPPSDYLKMNPVWDNGVKNIIRQIRGGVSRGTLWEIEDTLFKALRKKIAEHVYGVA